MNILHAAIRYNSGVLPKLIDFIEDKEKLYLSASQTRQLLNGDTLVLKKSPLHFVGKFGTNDSLSWLFQTHHTNEVDVNIKDSKGTWFSYI